ncbi:MAG: DUF58 domain-containing protein [Planctomycetota bacterium]
MTSPALLTPTDRAALRHVVFASRRPVTGHYAGRHASPQRGHSVEFLDYRDYTPGDTPNDIDWKVFGRSDRLRVKRFEHQSDLTVHVLVDASGSMGYRGLGGLEARGPDKTGRRRLRGLFPSPQAPRPPGPSKYDHATRLAAAVGLLVTQQQDKVALAIAQDGLHTTLRPAGTFPHLRRLETVLTETEPRGESKLAAAMHGLAGTVRRKGLLLVLSDLAEPREAVLGGVDRWLHRGHEVIVLRVLHPDERRLPDLAEAVFVDSETGRSVRVNVDDLRPSYEQRFAEDAAAWRAALRARGGDYREVTTDTPPAEALRAYLFSRAISH